MKPPLVREINNKQKYFSDFRLGKLLQEIRNQCEMTAFDKVVVVVVGTSCFCLRAHFKESRFSGTELYRWGGAEDLPGLLQVWIIMDSQEAGRPLWSIPSCCRPHWEEEIPVDCTLVYTDCQCKWQCWPSFPVKYFLAIFIIAVSPWIENDTIPDIHKATFFFNFNFYYF